MAIDTGTPEPRSRRAILAGALTGLAGLIAGRAAAPDLTRAASGDPLIVGSTTNNAGTGNTTLTTSSTGTGLLITQNGAGTALRGSAVGPGSIAGFFTANNGTGISGVTGNGGTYGVFAQNNGAAGIAGALRAAGGNNHGVVASTANASKNAITASTNAEGGVAILAINTNPGTDSTFGTGIRALSGGGTVADIHPGGDWLDAAGEFAGKIGVLAATNSGDTAVIGLGGTIGDGVRGIAVDGSGVQGSATTGIGVTGYSEDGNAIWGHSTNSDGVHGEGGINGVSGLSSNASASGIYGENVDGSGVRGRATTNGTGVYGESLYGAGVEGVSTSYFGVHGQSESQPGVGAYSATNSGLYATSGIGEAMIAVGNVGIIGNLAVTGSVSKGGGSFKIDHPLEPANKFLYHSFVESPDMMNIYNGIVTTDAKGDATVKLPDWFSPLNRDFRYQLTVIGRWSEAWISAEVQGNAFSLATKVPGTKVSWQLTGIRQDAWANAHRVVAEVAKTGAEKGHYVHPKENGQPESKGIGYAERKAIEAKLAKPKS